MKNKAIYIFINICANILFCYWKIFSVGWITVIMIWFGIIPLYLVLFNISAWKFMTLENKDVKKLILYITILCSFLISSLTFVDMGDSGESNRAIYSIPEGTAMNISIISMLVCFITSIIGILKFKPQKNEIGEVKNV